MQGWKTWCLTAGSALFIEAVFANLRENFEILTGRD